MSVHSAALHQLANRLVGMLQDCVTASARYGETTAWPHHLAPLDIQAHGMAFNDCRQCSRWPVGLAHPDRAP